MVMHTVTAKKSSSFDTVIRYGLYPMLLIYMLLYAWYEVSGQTIQLGDYRGIYLIILMTILLLAEVNHPLRKEWSMTRKTFFGRDVPFMLIGGLTILLSQYIGLEIILWFGLIRGESHLTIPVIPAVILILMLTDFFWYWTHRWSHEGKGKIGKWMWKMHVAHHLPQQVYLFMHGVAHPINTLIVRVIFTVPLFLLGFSTEAIFVAGLVTGLQGLVSHFNVDCRAGWINYVLIGAETHRYHHSANPTEAKNYASTITLWDILFGTFVYKPDNHPDKLGVANPELYPDDHKIMQVLAIPFK